MHKNLFLMPLLWILAVGAPLSGCVVQSNSASKGVLEVRWAHDAAACQGIASVRVRVDQSGTLRDESPKLACAQGSHSFSLPAGIYTVTVQAFDQSEALAQQAKESGLSVSSNTNTLTPVLTWEGSTAGGKTGSLTVKWQVQDTNPSVGCSKLGLKNVTLTVFDAQLAKSLGGQKVVCEAGEATLSKLPVGKVWLQIDATDDQGYQFYGNLKAVGPVEIMADANATLSSPMNVVDLRASINIPWEFDNKKTCGGNNVSLVKIEIRRPQGKILVPMTAKDATKPCDIHHNTPLLDRVIDLQFENPTCAPPAGAEGLIICGILEHDLDIRAVTVDESNGQIKFGGWLKIRDLALGEHSNNTKPLHLQPCGTSGVDCSTN